MDQFLLASGLYGFCGSILLVVFHLIPDLKERLNPKIKPFFHGRTQEERSLAERHYSFYSQLWSFRLIGTSFLIIILHSLFPSESANSLNNLLFVVADVCVLSYIAGWGIDGVSKNTIKLHTRYAFYFYVPMILAFYIVSGMLNLHWFFLASGAIAQILFSLIWFLKINVQT